MPAIHEIPLDQWLPPSCALREDGWFRMPPAPSVHTLRITDASPLIHSFSLCPLPFGEPALRCFRVVQVHSIRDRVFLWSRVESPEGRTLLQGCIVGQYWIAHPGQIRFEISLGNRRRGLAPRLIVEAWNRLGPHAPPQSLNTAGRAAWLRAHELSRQLHTQAVGE